MPRLFHEAVERAGERRAAPRSDLDAGAWRGHPEHDARASISATVILLIVGGNDTTRNSITGGLLFLSQNPDEFAKLRAQPGTDRHRWCRRSSATRRRSPTCAAPRSPTSSSAARPSARATRWRCGTSRATATRRRSRSPTASSSTAPRPRQHLSFGFGIHRCVGNRLAEMQLKILWEEILDRLPAIEVVGEPKRLFSSFVHGISELMVRIPA